VKPSLGGYVLHMLGRKYAPSPIVCSHGHAVESCYHQEFETVKRLLALKCMLLIAAVTKAAQSPS
jgi:hypothetical protein